MAKNAKARPRENIKEQILDAAIELFAKKGYNGVSMRDVAKAVLSTPAAIYYHFADKDQLYVEMLRHALKELRLDTLWDEPDEWKKLESYLTKVAQQFQTQPNAQRLTQWMLVDSDEPTLIKLTEQVFKDIFVPLFEISGKLSHSHDPHQLATSIISLVTFPYYAKSTLKLLPGFKEKSYQSQALAKHIITILKHGIQ